MLVVSSVLAVIAALLHVYIFILESLRWTAERTRAIFGTSEAEAEATKQLAFNQGFYNLFLAIVALVGVALVGTPIGVALIVVAVGSMLAAALVLALSDRTKLRSALVQGTVPLLTLVALLLAALV